MRQSAGTEAGSERASGFVAVDERMVGELTAPRPSRLFTDAVTNYFLKIDGIEGGSIDTTHLNEIEILSYSWGVHATGLLENAKVSHVATPTDVSFTKLLDRSSPKLAAAVTTGQHLQSAVLTSRRTAKDLPYLKITLTNVLVTNYVLAASAGGYPDDQFSLNFGKIQVEYLRQKADGTLDTPVGFIWDVVTAKGHNPAAQGGL